MRDTPQEVCPLYASRNTFFTKVGTGWDLILNADPSRWAVRFEVDNSPGSPVIVIPAPSANGQPIGTVTNLPLEYKFRDFPSQTVGEFYVRCAAGIVVRIIECIYKGN